MVAKDTIAKECCVFFRYLTGMNPDEYISHKYSEAFQVGGVLKLEVPIYFDRLLLQLALINPFFTHAIDIYSRIFRSDSVVRTRLILLLALAESWSPSSKQLNKQVDGSKTVFIIGMLMRSLLMIVLLIITSLFLFPIQYMTTRSSGNY